MPLSLPCHGDWDFRIHPGTFDLYLGPVLDALRRFVSGRREYYARNRKRPDGYRSHIDHIAAVDWLEDAANRANLIVWDGEPDLIWHLASELVYSDQWARARCPTCRAEHLPGAGRVAEWLYGSGLAAEGGRRYE